MSIYMFHYVTKNFNYYHFDLDLFEKFVCENKKNIISLSDYLIICNANRNNDPSDKIVLTFDDGTIDHYNNVHRILKKYGVTGVFSVCDNIFDGTILNIQKIHLLMSKIGVSKIYDEMIRIENLLNKEMLKLYLTKENAVKKYLQRDISFNQASDILDKIANRFNISFDFDKIYINPKQLKEMQVYGHEFIYHTKNHLWLSFLDKKTVKHEIENVIKYLKENFLKGITLPFGNYSDELLEYIKDMGIDFILGIGYNNSNKYYSRLDCNLIK